MGYVRLQKEPFSIDAALRELTGPTTGGVTLYVGTVRGHDRGTVVDALHYEAFPEMAQQELERLRRETVKRFGLVDALVIHRLGRLRPGEPILLVGLSGTHRKETFGALDHFMDRLKQIVPIWKQQETPKGRAWILGAEHRRVKR